jgi:hypothetical protein
MTGILDHTDYKGAYMKLRENLEAWRVQIEEYDPSQDWSPGPLYMMAINNSRTEILRKLDELLEEK